MMDYIWTLTDSTCLPEHILVDVDNLELTPSPYKVYRVDDLEPEDDDKHGITYSGWNLEITIDAREVVEHDAITKTENGHTIVIRPNVAPFRYEAWIRDNKIVVKVPLLSWSDCGNDDWMLRELYSDQDSCKPYIAGHDEFRKRLIKESEAQIIRRPSNMFNFISCPARGQHHFRFGLAAERLLLTMERKTKSSSFTFDPMILKVKTSGKTIE